MQRGTERKDECKSKNGKKQANYFIWKNLEGEEERERNYEVTKSEKREKR